MEPNARTIASFIHRGASVYLSRFNDVAVTLNNRETTSDRIEVKAGDVVTIGGERVYEPLLHEWMHNLDWALYEINGVPDLYQHVGPNWARWDHGEWPACGGSTWPRLWFPSVDYCEWDPDWRDCNNVASAGSCLHAGEVDGEASWYEHVISVHYPRDLDFIGNFCRKTDSGFAPIEKLKCWTYYMQGYSNILFLASPISAERIYITRPHEIMKSLT